LPAAPVWEVDPIAEGEAAPTEVPSAAAPPSPVRIVEALLFVGGPPLTAVRVCETVRGLTEAQFLQTIDALNREYRQQGRPYSIQPHGQGYLLALRSRYKHVLEKLFGSVREARLSQAAIDVLSLVAYRQPASKQEIDSARGAESGGVLRQLVRRGLITVMHRGEAGQREVRYGTTPRFLELFGLSSLDDLPQTQDLQKL
jgi:segregation and condensation protein B